MDAFDQIFGEAKDGMIPVKAMPCRKPGRATYRMTPTPPVPVPAPIPARLHASDDARLSRARGKKAGGGHPGYDAHRACAPADPIIEEIRALWRMRQRWHSAEKALVLQAKAVCRAFCLGDKVEANKLFDRAESSEDVAPDVFAALAPFLFAIERFRADRTAYEKRLKKLAKSLPIWPWAEAIKGFGELSLAAIIGEAGDITAYRTVSCLWKRMGLAVLDGERQRRCADAEKAIAHGYSPRRRSVMWNIGGSVIGGMGHGPRPFLNDDIGQIGDWTIYQKLFVERCRFYSERDDDKREPVLDKGTGAFKESYSKHVSARAKRVVEKRLLRDLWVEARRVARGD